MKKQATGPSPPPSERAAAAAAEGSRDPNEADVGMTEYPLFEKGTSLMHYAFAAKTQTDFPGYGERLTKYQRWAEEGFDTTAASDEARVPFLMDYVQFLNLVSVQERHWRIQVEFSEMVMEYAEKHVMGYWADSMPSTRTLDTLCSRTAYARVLSREPHDGLEYNHHYDEVNNPQSRFYKCIADWKKANPKAGLACLYLMEFTPRDVRALHARFPKTRIVGITTPRRNGADAKEIAQILSQMNLATTLPAAINK